MECDFCNEGPTEALYPVEGPAVVQATPTATLVMLTHRWVACMVCRDLIAAGDREGLLRRAVEEMATKAPAGMTFEEIAQLVRQIQDSFYASKPLGVRRAA